MIVCSCRAISDRELRMAAEAGRSLAEIVRSTGATTDCGCCAGTVERIVAAAQPCRDAPCPGCPNAAARTGAGLAA
ncbi:MAG TPA: (2Fe-2S)-binding protein [Anaeromyxobacteraceae bacterium]|nr:(2Fe-2S)-binding protein [Anaeromyxobacteraceae bacterium]